MKPTLLVLAAGMSSRYGGGLKQIDPIGPTGEIIIDYSIYDAVKAGFGKVVFVIRKSIEQQFKEAIGNKYKGIEVAYAFQEMDMLPKGSEMDVSHRLKPWGTAHAVWCAKDVIHEPFAIINADDFYGYTAFKQVADFLVANNGKDIYSIAGYQMKYTMSEEGSVNRGVCEKDAAGNLVGIVERIDINKTPEGIVCMAPEGKIVFKGDEPVSMNFMGFTPLVFKQMETYFVNFLKEIGQDPKKEFFIPLLLNHLVKTKETLIKVLDVQEEWIGVTYAADKAKAAESIKKLVDSGKYPLNLWK
ncbi:MAG: sugar phosphate nucleotidyltransferase [Bacteroidota bacterium]|nr:sugar phosphate nucleotidyltransferase [Bacteroidota bacterium]